MLTPGVDEAGLWLTVTELARQKGVSKQALAKRVDRFEKHGLLKSKPGERGTKLVNVAEFDRAAGEATDAVRMLNGTGSEPAPSPVAAEHPGAPTTSIDPGLHKQQARRAAYDADLKQLDLEERLGKLIPIEDVQRAMVACAENIVRSIEQMSGRAEECAACVAKDGVLGARAFLKTLAREQRDLLARSMTLLSDDKEPDDEA